ncbi:MAG: hypothetical protein JWR21_2595 [Herminiimonas sp.]|nr:hypothetical protein [Herminiimonas sp.]
MVLSNNFFGLFIDAFGMSYETTWLPLEPPQIIGVIPLHGSFRCRWFPFAIQRTKTKFGDLKMRQTPCDLPVALTKSAAMRYLCECAGYGYHLFQLGSVPAAKLIPLIEKFDAQYGVLAKRSTRDYSRLKGRSRTRLVLFPRTSSPVENPRGEWQFWVMATDGQGALPTEKSTADGRLPTSRLTWGNQYELVSRPVRRRTGELVHVWTWALTEAHYARWKQAFKKAAGRVRSSQERKPNYLIKLVAALRNVPGFHAINRQKRALIDGADIPHRWHVELNLKTLGTVVNKALPVFGPERTAVSMLRDSGDLHAVSQTNASSSA